MSRGMRYVGGIAVLVFAAVGVLQAEQMVCNANADMIASETHGSPSPTFGPWAIQSADPLVTANIAAGVPGVSGWGSDVNGGGIDIADPYVLVNTTGGAFADAWVNIAKDEIDFHPSASYAILTWTAPAAGTIDLSATYRSATNDLTQSANVYILHHKIVDNSYLHLLDGYIEGSSAPTVASHLTNIQVAMGDAILFDVGAPSTNYTWIGFSGSITLTTVPEPSSVAILSLALIGMLAYAWRKRR